MTDNILLTQAAYDRLRDELEQLILVERGEIARRFKRHVKKATKETALSCAKEQASLSTNKSLEEMLSSRRLLRRQL